MIEQVNKEYLESHERVAIRVEMDEMWSFYHDKGRVKSGCGGLLTTRVVKARAFWFGSGEHKNLDKLPGLLEPLKTGKVYTDGNYAYYERFSSEVLRVTKENRQKKGNIYR
jgi:IS1 family transposase